MDHKKKIRLETQAARMRIESADRRLRTLKARMTREGYSPEQRQEALKQFWGNTWEDKLILRMQGEPLPGERPTRAACRRGSVADTRTLFDEAYS